MVAAAAASPAMGTSAAEAEDVEFVEFDQDDDDTMDEDDQAGGRAARALPVPHIRLPRTRGRLLGRSPFVPASSRDRFDSLSGAGNSGHGPQRSIEGWIILVSGVKEDAEEDDLYNAFCEFGHVKDMHFNLERRTGYAKELCVTRWSLAVGDSKILTLMERMILGDGAIFFFGYALVEYESFEEAQTAIKAMNGMQLLTKTIYVDWAFNRGPIQKVMSARPLRRRSRTPPRRLAALTY